MCLFLYFKSVLKKFIFLFLFFLFLDRFDVLISKINFKILKKYYFNLF